MADQVHIDTTILDGLLRTLNQTLPVVRVGVLGNTANRDTLKGGSNNAEVGAAHEFGTSKLPRRSFLRVPLNEHLSEYIEKAGGYSEDTLKEVISNGSIRPWLEQIAKIAKAVVLDSFHTAGFGKWAPWKGNYSSRTGQILIDTTQLVKSITSDVK